MQTPEPTGSPPPSLRSLTDPITDGTRRYSVALFAIIALCFLLPFVSVSCAGQRLVTMDGLDFVRGGEVKIDPDFEEAMNFGNEFGGDLDPSDTTLTPSTDELTEERVDPNVFAIGALAAALAGLLGALIVRGHLRAPVLALAGLGVAVGLVGLRLDAEGDTGDLPAGAIDIEYRFGYWIALLLGLALALAHFAAIRRRGSRPDARPIPPAQPPSPPPR